MFNNTTGQIGDTPKACKVDPEEMLQQARSGLECIIKAQMLIQEITELPIYFEQMETEKALLTMLGELQVKEWGAQHAIDRWLAEIDKDD